MSVQMPAAANQISPIWQRSTGRTLTVLAPITTLAETPNVFRSVQHSPNRYEELLAGMQRLRGSVYLRDGAIQATELTTDGRHVSRFDRHSWHVLTLDRDGHVCGCARYTSHGYAAAYANLGVRSSALAGQPDWRDKVQAAVEAEMTVAGAKGVPFVEVGGWALDGSARCTSEAVRIALSAYALSRNLGGCVGLTTATVRHDSATILQKIGGRPLRFDGSPLPSYYDARYECEMTILRFDSSEPNPRYEPWIEVLREELTTVRVVTRANPKVATVSPRALIAYA